MSKSLKASSISLLSFSISYIFESLTASESGYHSERGTLHQNCWSSLGLSPEDRREVEEFEPQGRPSRNLQTKDGLLCPQCHSLSPDGGLDSLAKAALQSLTFEIKSLHLEEILTCS